MAVRKFFRGSSPAGSGLFGYNYGAYPIHKFIHTSMSPPYIPVTVLSCGDDYWHCKCLRERKNSATFAVEYVQEGVFIFNHNGVAHRCVAGDIFIVHLGADCSMRCETEYARKKTICLRGALLPSLIGACKLHRVSVIHPVCHDEIDRCFDEINALAKSGETDSHHRFSRLSYALLLELAQQAEYSLTPLPLQKAEEFIRAKLRTGASLQEMAAYAGVSQMSLHRLFKKYHHTSPMNYFMECRMAEARILLKNNMRIKEIASLMNFSSVQYFSSEFKKRFGVSPVNYDFNNETGN